MQVRNGQTIWSRSHSAEPDSDHEPLFDGAERIDIDQLLLYVDRKTEFLSAFEHVMGRYQRDRASPPITIAALMAHATNIGLGRMAEISNLTRAQLASTAANFIRLETLKEANDRLANATARLPIFRHYDIGDVVHSSSDGQKSLNYSVHIQIPARSSTTWVTRTSSTPSATRSCRASGSRTSGTTEPMEY